jgi:hypothetical protein
LPIPLPAALISVGPEGDDGIAAAAAANQIIAFIVNLIVQEWKSIPSGIGHVLESKRRTGKVRQK